MTLREVMREKYRDNLKEARTSTPVAFYLCMPGAYSSSFAPRGLSLALLCGPDVCSCCFCQQLLRSFSLSLYVDHQSHIEAGRIWTPQVILGRILLEHARSDSMTTSASDIFDFLQLVLRDSDRKGFSRSCCEVRIIEQLSHRSCAR